MSHRQQPRLLLIKKYTLSLNKQTDWRIIRLQITLFFTCHHWFITARLSLNKNVPCYQSSVGSCTLKHRFSITAATYWTGDRLLYFPVNWHTTGALVSQSREVITSIPAGFVPAFTLFSSAYEVQRFLIYWPEQHRRSLSVHTPVLISP